VVGAHTVPTFQHYRAKDKTMLWKVQGLGLAGRGAVWKFCPWRTFSQARCRSHRHALTPGLPLLFFPSIPPKTNTRQISRKQMIRLRVKSLSELREKHQAGDYVSGTVFSTPEGSFTIRYLWEVDKPISPSTFS